MSLNHFQTISCSFCTFAYVWSAVVPKVVGKFLGPMANADEPLADREPDCQGKATNTMLQVRRACLYLA